MTDLQKGLAAGTLIGLLVTGTIAGVYLYKKGAANGDSPIVIADDGIGGLVTAGGNAALVNGIHFRHRGGDWQDLTVGSGQQTLSTALSSARWLIADPDHEDIPCGTQFSFSGFAVGFSNSCNAVIVIAPLGVKCTIVPNSDGPGGTDDPSKPHPAFRCAAVSIPTGAVGATGVTGLTNPHYPPAYGASGKHYFLFSSH